MNFCIHTEKYTLELNKYYLFQIFHKFLYPQIHHKHQIYLLLSEYILNPSNLIKNIKLKQI